MVNMGDDVGAQLTKLVKVLKTLREAIETRTEYIAEFVQSRDRILSSVSTKYPHAKTLFPAFAKGLLTESTNLSIELPKLEEYIVTNVSILDMCDTIPLLAGIWSGDTYDCTGVDALTMYTVEFKKRSKSIKDAFVQELIRTSDSLGTSVNT